MKTYSQPAIIWPEKYTPGETDNYVSNEVIVKGLSVADVLPYLADTKAWGTYYHNAEISWWAMVQPPSFLPVLTLCLILSAFTLPAK